MELATSWSMLEGCWMLETRLSERRTCERKNFPCEFSLETVLLKLRTRIDLWDQIDLWNTFKGFALFYDALLRQVTCLLFWKIIIENLLWTQKKRRLNVGEAVKDLEAPNLNSRGNRMWRMVWHQSQRRGRWVCSEQFQLSQKLFNICRTVLKAIA